MESSQPRLPHVRVDLFFIGTAAFGHHPGELSYAVNGGGVVVSGDINGDGVADFSFNVIGVSSLLSADFIL